MEYADLHHPWISWKWFMYVCQLTSPIGYLENRSCTYVCQLTSLVKMNIIQYADMHHPCVVRILWSMLTYITNGYLGNGSCIYVCQHSYLESASYVYVNWQICVLPIYMSTLWSMLPIYMSTYTTYIHACQLWLALCT